MRIEDAEKSLTMGLDWGNRRVWINGTIQSKAEADELIKFLNFVKSETNFFPDVEAQP